MLDIETHTVTSLTLFSSENKDHLDRLFGIIVVVAFFLRSLTINEYYFNIDESVNLLFTRVVGGGSYVYSPFSHGPIPFYITSAISSLHELNLYTARFSSLLISVLTIIFIIYLDRYISKGAIVLAAAILAVHPYAIRVGQIYRQEAYLAAFLLFSVIGYARYKQNPTKSRAVIFGITLALSVGTHEIAWLFVPAIFVIPAGYAVYSQITNFRSKKERYFPTDSFLSLFFSFILSTMSIYSGWKPSISGFLTAPITVVEGLQYWANKDDPSGPLLYYPELLFDTPLLLGLSILGILISFRYNSNIVVKTFSGWFVFGTILLLVIRSKAKPTRIILLLIPLSILTGYTLSFACKKIVDRATWCGVRLRPKQLFIVILILTTLLSSGLPHRALGMQDPQRPTGFIGGMDYNPGLYENIKIVAEETNCSSAAFDSEYFEYVNFHRWFLNSIDSQNLIDVNRPMDRIVVSNQTLSYWDKNGEVVEYNSINIYYPESGCDV